MPLPGAGTGRWPGCQAGTLPILRSVQPELHNPPVPEARTGSGLLLAQRLTAKHTDCCRSTPKSSHLCISPRAPNQEPKHPQANTNPAQLRASRCRAPDALPFQLRLPERGPVQQHDVPSAPAPRGCLPRRSRAVKQPHAASSSVRCPQPSRSALWPSQLSDSIHQQRTDIGSGRVHDIATAADDLKSNRSFSI
ncbi:hypothetical protein Anapl_03028 [Anas platyrhynchos]|uniref:Uncharacterized protein n=1 Tax=Anas platyrhynchos TaxID=8839 RepID=R0KYB2_ANAPL|nr:hypothetical protein Anapl_03028 [Anas platyrhynchos]